MPSTVNQQVPVLPSTFVPTVAEVDRIVAVTNPVLRNLYITQCYAELSLAFAERFGPGANWCTFATWASKQAGQTIRLEDLERRLEAMLKNEPEVYDALSLIATLAKQLGTAQSLQQIRESALCLLIKSVAERASVAVSRGNKKVFEEIAREFARFISTSLDFTSFSKAQIDEFCSTLRPGGPPEGQDYLRNAFGRYYSMLFEEDPRKRTEKRLLANLEIGFHEQTRLQPEIAESLNAAAIDQEWIKSRLLAILFPQSDLLGRSFLFFKRVLGRTSLLDKAIELLVLRAQHHIRRLLTSQLMTLTLPPDNCLRLGRDLISVYPPGLQQLSDHDLLELLAQIDPTPNSLAESGATDWADMRERIHFIAELFRCYHEAKELFDGPFADEQLAVLKAGKIPTGSL